MDIGKFSTTVRIQSPVSTQDGAGQPVVGWDDVCTVRADVRHLSGMETIRAGAETSTVKASVRLRWRDDVDATCRVLVGSTSYNIRAVMPDARRRFMDLACEVAT